MECDEKIAVKAIMIRVPITWRADRNKGFLCQDQEHLADGTVRSDASTFFNLFVRKSLAVFSATNCSTDNES